MTAVVVDQLKSQLTTCKSAEDWLNMTRVLEANLHTASAAYRYEQLSALYCQAFRVFSKFSHITSLKYLVGDSPSTGFGAVMHLD